MKSHGNRSLLFKVLFSALILGIVGIATVKWNGESVESEYVTEIVDVPHSFTPNATQLINRGDGNEKIGVSRLNKFDIKYGLRPTFECNGLKMEENLSLTIGDMLIPLTGYDAEMKIGYIWLDYNLFGEGILEKSFTQYKSQKKAEQEFLNQIETGIELFFEDEDKFLLDVFGEDPSKEDELFSEEHGDSEEVYKSKLIKDIESFTRPYNYDRKGNPNIFQDFDVRRLESMRVMMSKFANVTRNKWDFFEEAYSDPEMLYEFGQEIKEGVSELKIQGDRKEYLEIIFGALKKRIFLMELNTKGSKNFIDEWVFSAAEMISDPIRFFGFVERIKNLSNQYSSSPFANAMDNEILKISTTKDKKKWWKHSEALINLLQSNKFAEFNSIREYNMLLTDIISNIPYDQWDDHYHRIDELGNKYTVSLNELKALPGLAASHGIYIAPLSILDDRTIYDMQGEEHEAKLADLRTKINETKDKALRKKHKEELLKLSQHRSKYFGEIRDQAKAKPLHKIIENMESFIDWAKSESLSWHSKVKA